MEHQLTFDLLLFLISEVYSFLSKQSKFYVHKTILITNRLKGGKNLISASCQHMTFDLVLGSMTQILLHGIFNSRTDLTVFVFLSQLS